MVCVGVRMREEVGDKFRDRQCPIRKDQAKDLGHHAIRKNWMINEVNVTIQCFLKYIGIFMLLANTFICTTTKLNVPVFIYNS